MKTFSIDVTKDSVLNPTFDKRSEVFMWGLSDKDNKLPSIIKYLSQESVTAKACISKCLDAILGKGFNKNIVVGDNGLTINKLHRQTGREIISQSNAFIHVRYDANLEVSKLSFEKCERVRIGRSDDREYSGKFLVTDWNAKRILKDKIQVIDKFNSNKDVIKAQILAAGGIAKYKGQILHISKDSSVKYAPSDLNSVLEDCETEINSKKFTRNNSQFGFMNNKAVLVGKLEEQEERDLKRDFQNMQGAENASNLLIFQATNHVADLEKQMIIKDLTSNPSDKILSYSDIKTEANICKAFGVPVTMISGKSEGIFGNSGAMLVEMKKQLYASREYDRMLLEEAFRELLKDKDLSIIDPFQEEVKDETPKDVNAEAQATLRGSVGGVTALLAIQASVKEGKTTRESGISMLKNIYGFTDEIAKEMLGEVKENIQP